MNFKQSSDDWKFRSLGNALSTGVPVFPPSAPAAQLKKTKQRDGWMGSGWETASTL